MVLAFLWEVGDDDNGTVRLKATSIGPGHMVKY